ncbi:MAG: hypothetical protein AAF126_01490 [Chloroflexota bacterium]
MPIILAQTEWIGTIADYGAEHGGTALALLGVVIVAVGVIWLAQRLFSMFADLKRDFDIERQKREEEKERFDETLTSTKNQFQKTLDATKLAFEEREKAFIAKIDSIEDDRDRVKSERDASDKANKELKTKIRELETANADMEKRLHTVELQLEAFEEKQLMWKRDKQSMIDQANAEAEMRRKLKAENQAYAQQVSDQKKQIDLLNQRMDTMRDEHTELTASMRAVIDSQKHTISRLEEDIATLEAKLKSMGNDTRPIVDQIEKAPQPIATPPTEGDSTNANDSTSDDLGDAA